MKYIQQKLGKLFLLKKQIAELKAEKKKVEEQIFDDVVEGWDTKDDALNFSLAACNGHYDNVDVQRYRNLIMQVQKYKGEYVCVARRQLAPAYGGLAACIVFDLGVLSGDIIFDVNNQYIQINTEHGSIVSYRDYFNAEDLTVVSTSKVSEQSYVIVYPFLNQYDGRSHIYHDTLDFGFDLDVAKQPFTVVCGTRNTQNFFRKQLKAYYEDFLYCEGLLTEVALGGSKSKSCFIILIISLRLQCLYAEVFFLWGKMVQ